VLALTLVGQVVGAITANAFAYLIGAESREHFLVRNMGFYAEAMDAVNHLPANARVQFMWEPRSYLALRSVRADPLLDALPHLVTTSGTLDAGVQKLKRDGFTHVLVYETGARFAFDNIRDEFSANDARNLAALEREPHDALATEYLAQIFEHDLNDPQRALSYLVNVQNLVPAYADAYFRIGSIFFRLEQYRTAVQYLTTAIDLDKGHVGEAGKFGLPLLGQAYLKLDRLADARQAFARALVYGEEPAFSKAQLDKIKHGVLK